MAVYTITQGEKITASILNTYAMNSGLVYVTQTTLSGTSTTISNCFSSTYDNYRIVISGGSTASGDNIKLQLNGATGATYYEVGLYMTYGSATITGYAPAATTTWLVGYATTTNASAIVDLISPNLAKQTLMKADSMQSFQYAFTGYESSTAQHTGFTISHTAAFSSTLCTVYGYRKS